MRNNTDFDVIIIGGSYAGLSAAMALGRAMRNVLVIDGAKPSNRFTPHSHNFITQDGRTPAQIAAAAKEQVLHYPTVKFMEGVVRSAGKQDGGFTVGTESGSFSAAKLLLATGIRDVLPEIEGVRECWGKSVIHCPYCHGYEVRKQETGILADGDMAMHLAMLISNWTERLTLFTNGTASLNAGQAEQLRRRNIEIIEEAVISLVHETGYLKSIRLQSGREHQLSALYLRPGIRHSNLPEMLGCGLSEAGYLKVDDFKRTTVAGVYAAGDNMSPMRSVAAAVAAGNAAGAFINNDLIMESAG